ncbi:MAG TPA: HAD family hydrolase [Gemmataceae bacterium]|nr:HAD family hydrolase [Gemmataceae bacterium]
MQTIQGVILDVDGTLVNSNDAHARAWVEALAENGISVPFEMIRGLIGMGGDKLLPRAAGLEESSEKGKQISDRRGQIFKDKFLPRLKPFAGAKELLERMHSEGLRLVVASSAKEDELKPLLKLCGADSLVESKTSSDDADNSKPDPDIVRAALRKLKLKPSEVLMLGDTPYDIEAAARSGVATVALRCGGWTDAKLVGAVAVYQNTADLLIRYDSSPFARLLAPKL